jgi:hypothetical protein
MSSLDHNSFDALRPAGAKMETTKELLARLEAIFEARFEEKVAHLRQELQKVKENDASTSKHVES